MSRDASKTEQCVNIASGDSEGRRVVLKDHLIPQNDVSEAGFRVLNHIRSESRFMTSQPCNPTEPLSEERQREYRASLASLLAGSLEGLAHCEQESISEGKSTKDGETIPELNSQTEAEGHDGHEYMDCDVDGEDSDKTSTAPINQVISSSPPESTTEPFPDYFESCETGSPLVDPEREQAYNFAISKVVEEVIRFRDIDSRVTAFPNFPVENGSPRTADNDENARNDNDNNDSSNASNQNSPDSQEAQSPRGLWNFPTNTGLFVDCRESDKLHVIEEMRRIVTDPRLHPSVKVCFQDLTNLVIRMEVVLFRNENSSPQEFLSAGDTYEVGLIATSIMRYLAVVDKRLNELLDVAPRVHFILGDVFRDHSVDAFIRYRRLVHVVLGNQLYQANEIEKQILTTFFDLYDTFVYTSFLNMRNRQILLEEMIDIERNEITRLLVALWDVLCRVIENYDGYLDIMMRIEHEYLSPTGAEVNRLLNPHIGTRFEERMRMLMDEGIDAYPDMNLSVLRAEDSRFP